MSMKTLCQPFSRACATSDKHCYSRHIYNHPTALHRKDTRFNFIIYFFGTKKCAMCVYNSICFVNSFWFFKVTIISAVKPSKYDNVFYLSCFCFLKFELFHLSNFVYTLRRIRSSALEPIPLSRSRSKAKIASRTVTFRELASPARSGRVTVEGGRNKLTLA